MDEDNEDAPNDEDEEAPDFSCTFRKHKYHLHTHAAVDNVVYSLGTRALEGGSHSKKSLTSSAATLWNTFTTPKVKAVIEKTAPALKIRVPGGKSLRNSSGSGSK